MLEKHNTRFEYMNKRRCMREFIVLINYCTVNYKLILQAENLLTTILQFLCLLKFDHTKKVIVLQQISHIAIQRSHIVIKRS